MYTPNARTHSPLPRRPVAVVIVRGDPDIATGELFGHAHHEVLCVNVNEDMLVVSLDASGDPKLYARLERFFNVSADRILPIGKTPSPLLWSTALDLAVRRLAPGRECIVFDFAETAAHDAYRGNLRLRPFSKNSNA